MELICTPQASHLDLDATTLDPHPDNDALQFPDGEVYVQLPLDGIAEAVVVHSGAPEPNAGMMYLYGVLERLRAEDVACEVVFTYPPYGMQDAAFQRGTLNYARAVLTKIDRYYGVEAVYAVDPHFAERDWAEGYAFEDLSALPLIEDAVTMDDYVVVGPDAGSADRFAVEAFAKERSSAEEVAVSGDVDVAGRNVLVVDDIIETGGTMAAAYDELQAQGADRVEAAAVHGVLAEGVDRVQNTYDRLHLANTVDREQATVAVEPLLRDAMNL